MCPFLDNCLLAGFHSFNFRLYFFYQAPGYFPQTWNNPTWPPPSNGPVSHVVSGPQPTPSSSVRVEDTSSARDETDCDVVTHRDSDVELDDIVIEGTSVPSVSGGDENNNSDQCLDESESNVKVTNDVRLQGFRKLFRHLQYLFPDKFKSEKAVVPYYLARKHQGAIGIEASSGKAPYLLVDPPLSGSWFDPPSKHHPDDSVTFWPENSGFSKLSKINPKDFKFAAKSPCPYTYVVDDNLREFFKAPAFKQADLDHSAFDKSVINVSFSPHSTLDAMLRPALHDSYVIDELLQMALSIVGTLDSDSDDSRMYEPLLSTLELVAECNQRSGQHIMASLVANKVFLRESVLKKFYVPDLAKSLLRGSNFKSDKLFGSLPESFKTSLLHPSGKDLRCTSKDQKPRKSVAPSTSFKRPSTQPAASKRLKGSSYKSAPKTFFRPKTQKKK